MVQLWSVIKSTDTLGLCFMLHAMRRRCIYLHLSDAATICKLFDILMLHILSYSWGVWAVNPKVGQKAELVSRQLLRQLLGIKKSTTNQIVLAEFGRVHKSFMTSWTFPPILNERKHTGLRPFFLTQTIAACNCTGLCTSMITQFTSTLTTCPLSNAIHTQDWSVGSDVVAMACVLTQVVLARALNIAAGRTGSVLRACPVKLKPSNTFCLIAPRAITYVSNTATFFIRPCHHHFQ